MFELYFANNKISHFATGRLISVRGTVVRMSVVRPLVVEMHFTCAKCGYSIDKQLSDGRYSPPTSCGMHGCKSKTFQPNRTLVKTINFQVCIWIFKLLFTHIVYIFRYAIDA